jgi:phosphohistidine phosphatase
MRITLIRHGAAGEAASDEDRALTTKGRAAVRRVAGALARRKVRFDLVVTSPLVRAVQTAEIIVQRLAYAGEVVIDRRLVPEASPARLLAFLRALDSETRVALVAHEPILSEVACAVLGRSLGGFLKKGEAMRIRVALDRPASLRWRIIPTKDAARVVA